jgi:hypothetical protein
MMKMISESSDKKEFMNKLEDYCVAGDKPLLIPAGKYLVQCDECKEVYFKAYNSHKLVLTLRILEGEYGETELFMFINLTDSRTGKKYKKFSPKTEFYKNWVIANNDRLPPRHDRMPYSVFKNGIFEVKVRNTNRKHRDGMALPECLNYSVVDHLIKRLP